MSDGDLEFVSLDGMYVGSKGLRGIFWPPGMYCSGHRMWVFRNLEAEGGDIYRGLMVAEPRGEEGWRKLVVFTADQGAWLRARSEQFGVPVSVLIRAVVERAKLDWEEHGEP